MILGIVALLVIVSVAVYFMKSETPNKTSLKEKNITIGAVLAMSGYASVDGEDIKNGIELAKADLKKEGITLNVEYYDDGTDPKKTISGLELMNSKGIKSIIGPTWGFQVTAAMPVFDKNNMLGYVPSSGSDVVIGNSDRVFYGQPKVRDQVKIVSDWIKNTGVKKLALMTVNSSGDSWGDAHISTWQEAAKLAGVQVVVSEKIDLSLEINQMPLFVLKAKSLSADAIIWSGTEGGAINMIKKMQELKYTPQILAERLLAEAVTTGKVTKTGLDISIITGGVSDVYRQKSDAAYGTTTKINYAESAYNMTRGAVSNEMGHGGKDLLEYAKDNYKNNVNSRGWIMYKL